MSENDQVHLGKAFLYWMVDETTFDKLIEENKNIFSLLTKSKKVKTKMELVAPLINLIESHGVSIHFAEPSKSNSLDSEIKRKLSSMEFKSRATIVSKDILKFSDDEISYLLKLPNDKIRYFINLSRIELESEI